MKLNQLSLTEVTSVLAKKQASARDVVRACLDRMNQLETRLRAFISWNTGDALAQAERADQAIAAGESHRDRPLLGVPIALKDVISVKGHPLTCGSRILEKFTSPYDSTVASRLREAGAILLGRLNMDEFAMGSSTENSAYQVTRNPWDLDRVAGGSSGGSAAAVSADECIAALGSDTGGSIRQPAALCSVCGLKPSYGRVSRYGLVAYASSLDQIGPLTKTVPDAAVLLRVIAGSDPRDSTTVPEPVPDYEGALVGGLRGLRLGLPTEYMGRGLDSQIREAVQAAVGVLSNLGAEIVEVSLPHTDYAIATYYIIATAEASANLARFDGVRYGLRRDGADPLEMYVQTRGAGFGTEVKRRIILGTYVLSSGYYDAYYLRAQKVRTLIRNDFLKAFDQVDALVTPATPTPAFRVGEKSADPLQMYLSDIFTISCNLAGVCGMSIPCGFAQASSSGQSPLLPIGLQLLGKAFGESMVLKIAAAYQQATDWHLRRPPLQL
jgi:aspartyl-tRNA(Asn)/glutamyl-tRNA(Gln) amidotransferase subunit A